MRALTDLHGASEAELWAMWNLERLDAAAAELWNRTQRVAVAVAARALAGLSNPLELAHELVDEAFVRALRTFDPARASTVSAQPFRSWFLRLVRSAAIDQRRRAAREVELVDVSVGSQPAPDAAPDARIDASRLVRLLQEWNTSEGLEEDWPVLVAWLQCRHDGVRVPWKSLAGEHPVVAPPDVVFATGAAETTRADPALQLAHRKLSLCPRLCLAADGARHPTEAAELAGQRAQWVVDLLRAGLRVRRARQGTHRQERLVVGGVGAIGRRVRFRTTAGSQRTPDALRMRVEKVILGKVLALVRGGRP